MSEINKELLDVLACPQCHGELTVQRDGLACPTCSLYFPVENGIPAMLMERATQGETPSDYSKYSKTKTESIEFYDNFYCTQTDYARYNSSDIAFLKAFFTNVKPKSAATRILDIGAGTCYFPFLINNVIDASVYGSDFSITGLKAAKSTYKLSNLAAMDAYKPALKDSVMDYIFAIGLTPFKKSDPAEIIDLIRRIIRPLKSGGRFVFIWSSNLSGKIEKSKILGQDDYTFYYNHKRSSIHNIFEDSGEFSQVTSYSFIRPLAPLLKSKIFTALSTVLSEAMMHLTLHKLSARIIVIGEKK